MGRRRKRSDSDEDDTLEVSYRGTGSSTSAMSTTTSSAPALSSTNNSRDNKRAKNSDRPIDNSNIIQKLESGHSQLVQSKDAGEPKKIEELRRKKQERKALKKAKQAERKQKEQIALQKQQETIQAQKKEKIRLQKEKKRREEQERKQTFVTSRMGVKYQDVVVGKGPEVQNRKKVRVSYTLRAKTRCGKIIDSSDNFGFRLGRGEVIEGWDIGVLGMRKGGTRHLIIPPNAGYGNKDIGAGRGGILFFQVTVL